MKNVEWIFFDIGGVLADESAYQAYRKNIAITAAASVIGVVSDEQYEAAYKIAATKQGSLTTHIVTELVTEAGKINDLSKALQMLEGQKSDHPYSDYEVVRPEALRVVSLLATRYKLGVIANQPPEILKKLEESGLAKYFSDLTIANDAEGKPNLAYYQLVLEKNGVAAENAVMIDDNLTRGILPAKQLGMKTVLFGASSSEDADFEVQNLDQLLGLFL